MQNTATFYALLQRTLKKITHIRSLNIAPPPPVILKIYMVYPYTMGMDHIYILEWHGGAYEMKCSLCV